MSLHDKEKKINLFDKDYYENGLEKGISGYTNYRWMPTRSIPEAIEIKERFDFKNCVDIGCAKGFLVHALRMLGCEAYGEDISEYAIESSHNKVKKYLSTETNKKYDLLICKDVLEHIHEKDLPRLLKSFSKRAKQFFFVIPLGDDNLFRIKEYEIDITHVTKKDEEWWIELFSRHGFILEKFSYSMGPIKEKWIRQHPYGNGFFVLKRKEE
tara:strand:- start:6517 stop:7152 length:636 start_codon:yes stop_codon:yes gene_type:complete